MFSQAKSKSFNVETESRPQESGLYGMLRSASDYVTAKLSRRIDTPERLKPLLNHGDLPLGGAHESYTHLDIGSEEPDDEEIIQLASASSSAAKKPDEDEEKMPDNGHPHANGHSSAINGHVNPAPVLNEFERIQQRLRQSFEEAGDPGDEPPAADPDAPIDEVQMNSGFIVDLQAASPLPRRFKARSHHLPAIAFSVVTSAVSMYLYGKGGLEQHDWRYPVGGILVNFSQGVGFGMGTYWFYLQAYQNFAKHWVSLIIASLLAIVATSPTIMATYFLSDQSLFWTALQLSGYPLNIFGMDSAINEFISVFDDNSRVRKFLMRQFKGNLLHEHRLLNLTADERSRFTKIAGKGIGVVLGTFLTAGMFGYFCDVADTLKDNWGTDLPTSYILSVLIFNFPSEVIAFLCSGINMGTSAANIIADLVNHIRNVKPIEMSMRDKEYTVLLTLITICSVLPAMFSDGTSKVLFAQCSDLFAAYPAAEALRPFLQFCITYGSQVFNWIMHSAFVKKLLDYVRVAYSDELRANGFDISEVDVATYLTHRLPGVEINDRLRYQVEQMSNTIQNGDAATLETIAATHFPQDKAKWEKQPKTGMFGLFHRRNAANDHAQRLLDAPDPVPQQANGNGYRR